MLLACGWITSDLSMFFLRWERSDTRSCRRVSLWDRWGFWECGVSEPTQCSLLHSHVREARARSVYGPVFLGHRDPAPLARAELHVFLEDAEAYMSLQNRFRHDKGCPLNFDRQVEDLHDMFISAQNHAYVGRAVRIGRDAYNSVPLHQLGLRLSLQLPQRQVVLVTGKRAISLASLPCCGQRFGRAADICMPPAGRLMPKESPEACLWAAQKISDIRRFSA